MALIEYETLTQPISDAAPCGPDLDLEGDLEFMNYLARAEGLLPATFFTRDPEGRQVSFDRTTIAFNDEARTIGELLKTTRDLRLLALLAKFAILNRDLAGLAQAVDIVARLLAERWQDVHPRGEGDDFTLRMVTLQTLDDSPTVILPLQHAPLVPSRRYGAITFRNIMVRQGEATAREDEDTPDDAAIEAAFREVDFAALARTRKDVSLLKDALARIRSTWLEKAGYDEAITFSKLAPLADKILSTLDDAVGRRDPGAKLAQPAEAPAEDGVPAPPRAAAAPASRVVSVVQAKVALAAVASYFAAYEPSSPALLLVRQAQHLIGKSFQEVIEMLLPSHAEQAAIRFGVDQVFELPIQRLSGVGPGDTRTEYEDSPSGYATPEGVETGDADAGSGAGGVGLPSSGGTSDRGSPPDPASAVARTRHEAVALLEQVGAFYRANEPASPIPLLTDRACGLSQKDFLTLLKDVLPGLRTAMSD